MMELPKLLPNSEIPRKGSKPKKVRITTFNEMNPLHMVECISLPNFANRGFSKAILRELIEGIKEMRCLKRIDLSNNGISLACQEEVCELFANSRLIHINLSKNNMNEQLAQAFAPKIQQRSESLVWLDISRNPFAQSQQAIVAVCSALKNQKKLKHLGISTCTLTAESGSDQVTRLLEQININSLDLIESKVSQKNIEQLMTCVRSGRLKQLDLKFTFIVESMAMMISKCQLISSSRKLFFSSTWPFRKRSLTPCRNQNYSCCRAKHFSY